MKNKIFIIIAGIFLTASFAAESLAEKEVPQDYHGKMRWAMGYASRGELPKAVVLFEEILKTNPDDKAVYEQYASALVMNHDLSGAVEVLERALKMKDQLRHGSSISIEDNMRGIKQIQQFDQLMEKQPGWEEARRIVIGKADIRTNIPKEEARVFGQRIVGLIEQEKAMLEKILGPAEKDVGYFRIIVPGRWEEYKEIYKQKFPGAMVAAAIYDEKTKELLVPYNGVADYFSTAHELVHYLMEDLYGFKSSRFLAEGLAEYVSFKLEKEDGEAEIREGIGLLNAFYDNGHLEHAMDIFQAWKSCDQSGRGNLCLEFYLYAWSLVDFFIDDGNEKWSGFFKEYLAEERKNSFLGLNSVEQYFRSKLSPEDIKDLDDKWAHFVLNMSYEKV